MPALQELDLNLFWSINRDWVNPFLDGLMPLMSGDSLLPVGFVVVAAMAWKMGRRGLAAIACLAIIIGLGEGLILSPLKEWIGRPRPPFTFTDVRLLTGLGGSGSMPSAHAANWGCVTAILFLFWRPSLMLTIPLALLVAYSRVYNGVHYPSDVVVGLLLGAVYGTLGVFLLECAWQKSAARWAPRALAFLPTFRAPKTATHTTAEGSPPPTEAPSS